MYKLFIADDEHSVVEGLLSCIDWRSCDVEIVGYAYNGKEAYHKIIESQPDMVITDIRMPEMNGLDMIEELRNGYPDMEFIIYSGYNEFEYAKQALRLDAVEFLVKPVDIEELLSAVRKAIKRLQIERKASDDKIDKVLLGRLADNDEQTLKENYFAVCVGTTSQKSCCTFDINIFSNHIAETLLKYGIQATAYEYFGVILLILEISKETINSEVKLITSEIEKQYSCLLEGCKNDKLYFGISEKCSLPNIKAAYLDAKRALEKAVFFSQSIVRTSENCYSETNIQDIDYKSLIYILIKSDDFTEVQAEFEVILQICIDRSLSPTSIRKICTDMVYHMSRILSVELSISLEQIMGESFFPDTEIAVLIDINGIKTWVLYLLKTVFDYRKSRKISFKDKAIKNIKNYISENLHRPISLEEIGKVINLTASYTSSLFKEWTGLTVTDYITDMRIEQSKSLLKYGNFKISEIATMIGFNEQRYFCLVFKRKTGMTATEYRNTCWTDTDTI